MTTLLLMVACETETAPVDFGPDLAGTVTAESGESGVVRPASAFGVSKGGAARVLISPNPDATCDDAAAFYGIDPDYNAEVVSAAGHCVVDVRLDIYEDVATNYDASTDALVSFNCAMDTGAWVFEKRSNRSAWYYSGPFWTGSPAGLTEYTLDVGAATAGSALDVTLGVSVYDGRFPYDNDEAGADPATGQVSGHVGATWCEAMESVL
ncbi:MAG: hypothetical protein EXR71_00635 [Myxococcales bacterium]|nr:hypothetical protein [Myxococcales bacterium]